MHEEITAAGNRPGRMLLAQSDKPAVAPLNETCGNVIKSINIAAKADFVKIDFLSGNEPRAAILS